ncbi:MAG: PIN domain-containing protein [Chthoniobacterales bacterium]|nr:PIN domain-containing protein [Chthoniobacterales bacterium]
MNSMEATPGKSALLDSSIVIHHLRVGSNLFHQLSTFTDLYLPNIALAELYFGAYRSVRVEKNLLQIKEFLEQVILVFPDDETSKTYGRVAANLAQRGKIIPQNDIWIASIALQLDLSLFTLDRHFEYIDGLEIMLW